MTSMTRSDAERILSRLMQAGNADEMHAVLRSTDGTAVRVAGNLPDAPHHTSDASLQVTVRVGARYASASGNDLSDAGLAQLVERAVRHAAVMPDTPEALPFPGPLAKDLAPPAPAAPAEMPSAGTIRRLIDLARKSGMLLSGSIGSTRSTLSVATSEGLFLHHPSDLVHAQFRVYSDDGMSTGFGEHFSSDIDDARIVHTLETAVKKCGDWRDPIELDPSRITTIFEPRALADMLAPFIQQFSRRAIDDNMSFLRKLDGSTFIGTRMFKEQVTLRSDPFAQGVLSFPFTIEGLPVHEATWVRDGVVEQVATDRYSAKKLGVEPVPPPTNLIMDGGSTSLEDLISETRRGLLVTGFADLRVIDPKNCLLSGSTRDGLFLIEDGAITRAVRNRAIRETPVYLFKELEALGLPQNVSTTGTYFPMRLPPIRVKDVMYGESTGLI